MLEFGRGEDGQPLRGGTARLRHGRARRRPSWPRGRRRRDATARASPPRSPDRPVHRAPPAPTPARRRRPLRNAWSTRATRPGAPAGWPAAPGPRRAGPDSRSGRRRRRPPRPRRRAGPRPGRPAVDPKPRRACAALPATGPPRWARRRRHCRSGRPRPRRLRRAGRPHRPAGAPRRPGRHPRREAGRRARSPRGIRATSVRVAPVPSRARCGRRGRDGGSATPHGPIGRSRRVRRGRRIGPADCGPGRAGAGTTPRPGRALRPASR